MTCNSSLPNRFSKTGGNNRLTALLLLPLATLLAIIITWVQGELAGAKVSEAGLLPPGDLLLAGHANNHERFPFRPAHARLRPDARRMKGTGKPFLYAPNTGPATVAGKPAARRIAPVANVTPPGTAVLVRVALRVEDERGQAVPGATFAIAPAQANLRWLRQEDLLLYGRTNANGEFLARKGVKPGNYRIKADCPGYLSRESPITISANGKCANEAAVTIGLRRELRNVPRNDFKTLGFPL